MFNSDETQSLMQGDGGCVLLPPGPRSGTIGSTVTDLFGKGFGEVLGGAPDLWNQWGLDNGPTFGSVQESMGAQRPAPAGGGGFWDSAGNALRSGLGTIGSLFGF